MTNIFVFGNSHGYLLINNLDLSKFLSNPSMTEGIEHKKIEDINIYSIYRIGGGIWWSSEEYLEDIYKKYIMDKCKPGDIIYGFMGDTDIRYYIPRYNNEEEIASLYVNRMKNVFEKYNLKVKFIEPVPICMEENWNSDNWYMHKNLPVHDKDTVKNIHIRFVNYLKNECLNNNIDDIIMISNNIISGDILTLPETLDARHLSREVNDRLIDKIMHYSN